MDESQVIIPSPRGAEGYVELARTRNVHGTLFRKHILNLGELIHPTTGERLQLDEPWFDTVKRNFENSVCDIVQVPLANDKNMHVEGPLSNAGEVVGLEREGNKVYSLVDIRRPDVVEGLRNKTILGASAFLNLDYTDTASGKKAGPTLLHHCITNRPYVTGLDDYEEVIAATADGSGGYVVLAQEEPRMDKTELLAVLKDEHGIDVEALQAASTARPDLSELTAALTAALKDTSVGQSLQLSGGQTLSPEDIVGAITELSQQNTVFGTRVIALERDKAEREVDGYIAQGRVLPKQKDTFVDLALTNRDMMETLLPDEPVVRLNNQEGVGGQPQGSQKHTFDVDAEILRLTQQHQEMATAQANGKGRTLPPQPR
jgi:hypothetical protein